MTAAQGVNVIRTAQRSVVTLVNKNFGGHLHSVLVSHILVNLNNSESLQ